MTAAPAQRLAALLNGYQASEALHAAAVLGIPEGLATGNATAAELAQRSGTQPHALQRLLGVLVALEVLVRDGAGRYGLSALGEALRPDAPGSWHPWAMTIGTPAIRAAWAHLVPALRSGTTAFDCAHGTDVWSHRSRNAHDGALFDRAMQAGSERLAHAVVQALSGQGCARIVDVGGGDGTLLSHLLHGRPDATGMLVERAGPAGRARARLAREGLAARAEVVEADFFQHVPAGADLYLLKFILHDWDDEAAARILRTCRQAAGANARTVVIERLLEAGCGAEAALSDLNMFVNTGGRERTLEQYGALLHAAGLRLVDARMLAGNVWWIASEPR